MSANLSILNNLLSSDRAEKLVANVIKDLVFELGEEKMSDDEYAKVLDKVMNSNAGIRAVSIVDEDALIELTVRVAVELEWQANTTPTDKAPAMRGLANYLAEWLEEKAEEEEPYADSFDDEEDEEKGE